MTISYLLCFLSLSLQSFNSVLCVRLSLSLPPFHSFSHLNDGGLVEDGVTDRLKPLHVVENLTHVGAAGVHYPEGGHVHVVVLEVFQVESLNVL